MRSSKDSAGNSADRSIRMRSEILMWPIRIEMGYTLIGSHLDSVIDGGRYDGVAGVIADL